MSLYQREQPAYLAACFASLAAQTVQPQEIILVLDGPIGTALQASVDDYRTRLPLHVVALPHNVGLGRALNAGLAHCRHEWVMRMDTDDVCVPERFARQWAYIQAHPATAVFSGQIAEFSTDIAHLNQTRQIPQQHAAIVRYAARRNPFNHMAVAYRKSAVLAVGGYQHHQWMEDYNLWLRMLAAGEQGHNLPEVLVYARANAAMYARRRGWRYVHSEWQLFRLKRQTGMQPFWPALGCLALRSASRLLPAAALTRLYRHLRQHQPRETS